MNGHHAWRMCAQRSAAVYTQAKEPTCFHMRPTNICAVVISVAWGEHIVQAPAELLIHRSSSIAPHPKTWYYICWQQNEYGHEWRWFKSDEEADTLTLRCGSEHKRSRAFSASPCLRVSVVAGSALFSSILTFIFHCPHPFSPFPLHRINPRMSKIKCADITLAHPDVKTLLLK